MKKLKMIRTFSLVLLWRSVIHQPCAEAFSASPILAESFSNLLAVRLDASRGMGMASTADRKKKRKSKSKSGNAIGKSASAKSSFNVNASLLRLEKKYEDLILANAKALQNDEEDDDDIVATEYIVAVRSTCFKAVSDWVPVAQLLLGRTLAEARTCASDGASDPTIQAAVSMYCRELSHVASLGSRIFQSVPRNQLEYSVESMDSFHKHVYEVLVEGKNDDASNDQVMTKAEARQVLELDETCTDTSAIKSRYRRRSYELHPDRFDRSDLKSDSEVEKALTGYARVKLAYETLISGVRQGDRSWYESLGGRARTEFVGPLTLLPLPVAEQAFATNGIQGALVGLDREMVQDFVARSKATQALRST